MQQKGFAPILVVISLLVFGLSITGAYYLGTKKSSQGQKSIEIKEVSSEIFTPLPSQPNNIRVSSPLPSLKSDPTPKPTYITVDPSPSPLSIPGDWKTYTGTDSDFGIITSMSMPPGFFFNFSGSEFTIQNDSDATELWDYSTSIFRRGECEVKNFYTGGSRRAWYQKKLNGDFAHKDAVNTKLGDILNVKEHAIGNQTYLEVLVKPTYGNFNETHFIYVQNNILHRIKPVSEVSMSGKGKLPQYMDIIFLSLKSKQIEPYKIYNCP